MSRSHTWIMDGRALPYQTPTQTHERDIELPWGADAIGRTAGVGRVLEVGNCLQLLYSSLPLRDIVCRYDETGGHYPVFLEDIEHWDCSVRYNTIVSLSTFEHVGKDYFEPDDNAKAIRAIMHCIHLLAPGGELAFTIPCGYHGSLQDWLMDRPWTSASLMVRVDQDNTWEQRPLAEYKAYSYPGRWGAASGVLFFRYERPGLSSPDED